MRRDDMPATAEEIAERRALLQPGQRATTSNGAPFPLRSWPPDAAIDIQNLANWTDPMKPETVRRFATVAARDAAVPSPGNGSMCVTTDTYTYWYGKAGVWVAGATNTGSLDFGAFQIRTSTVVATTDANGYLSLTFPTPFTQTCIGVVAMCGDAANGVNQLTAVYPPTKTGCQIRAITSAGGVAGNWTARLNYVAFGY